MKTKTHKHLKISLILIITLNMGITFCHPDKHEVQKKQTVELNNGCKLNLDSTINKTDSLSIEIIANIQDIIPKIHRLIPADSVIINLKICKDVVPVWGVGGNTTGDHSIDFWYDPDHENFKVEYIICGLAHEFMHVSRLRMPNWELTLFECMITEGLADHFSNEVLGCVQPVWTNALSMEQIKGTLIKSEPVLYIIHENWDNEFNENFFNPWMFGRNGDDPIPTWAGYSIGWALVENFIKTHPDKKASDIVWLSAKEFDDSLNKLKGGN